MAITKDTVRYVANLARVELSEKELEHFTGQLDRILEYVHKLKGLEVKELAPTSHVLDIKNVYRDDIIKESLPASEVIKNSPDREGDLFKVKNIIEA
ncbi:MAG: Asp-tRNA(Asn)/Glu-tRNA(Gln) amidotransferase subunit GatC [Candidatus Omnitrophica bacterium]|nr:Asp-tRNA(Asn)/Glu-tRNA(Gln) amidotransferase subunit GatC [Candidatus Omnitrophota bacterium]MBU1933335.1 Asp-tRNA(Asn)/Glu-tRNA(Gln) amidotransferase subunit GatC [Candidatus Omnitrophota bacterium]